MIREIKFRGYSKTYKCWKHGSLDVTSDGKCFIKSINERGMAERTRVDEESVGQWIGGKDWNERDIYEGDILSDDECNQYIVKWSDVDSAFYFVKDEVDDFNFVENWHSDFEVIGNEYEDNLNR